MRPLFSSQRQIQRLKQKFPQKTACTILKKAGFVKNNQKKGLWNQKNTCEIIIHGVFWKF